MQIAPELGVDVITVLFFQQALFHDNMNISVPLNYPVELLPTIEHKFDGFAYAKGLFLTNCIISLNIFNIHDILGFSSVRDFQNG